MAPTPGPASGATLNAATRVTSNVFDKIVDTAKNSASACCLLKVSSKKP